MTLSTASAVAGELEEPSEAVYEYEPPDVPRILAGMPDERLASAYQRARKEPGTVWHQALSEEIGRRDGQGRRKGK